MMWYVCCRICGCQIVTGTHSGWERGTSVIPHWLLTVLLYEWTSIATRTPPISSTRLTMWCLPGTPASVRQVSQIVHLARLFSYENFFLVLSFTSFACVIVRFLITFMSKLIAFIRSLSSSKPSTSVLQLQIALIVLSRVIGKRIPNPDHFSYVISESHGHHWLLFTWRLVFALQVR